MSVTPVRQLKAWCAHRLDTEAGAHDWLNCKVKGDQAACVRVTSCKEPGSTEVYKLNRLSEAYGLYAFFPAWCDMDVLCEQLRGMCGEIRSTKTKALTNRC